jgi:hypothetical protein
VAVAAPAGMSAPTAPRDRGRSPPTSGRLCLRWSRWQT